jgi:hypothetical protein
MYLRDTCFEVMKVDMHMGIRKLISSWLHIPDSNSILSKNNVRVLHPVEITDQLFNSIFSDDIVYYSTVYIGRVRFTISHHARNKVTDDSSIISKTGFDENFGRIRRIFTVNGGYPMFYVDVISKMIHFECTITTDTYSYPYIQTGSFDEDTNCIFISAYDIVEKCVFFERSDKVCTFYKFPNLEGCSWYNSEKQKTFAHLILDCLSCTSFLLLYRKVMSYRPFTHYSQQWCYV